MANGHLTRGTTKRCTTCGSSYVHTTLDGRKLVNGTECPKCEAVSIVERLLNRAH